MAALFAAILAPVDGGDLQTSIRKQDVRTSFRLQPSQAETEPTRPVREGVSAPVTTL